MEGEALAVAWALEQSRYFTQGCDKLIVVTDHQPLVRWFSDRTLDDITNTRLFRLKERTLMWYFKAAYLPGKSNHAADATSRHPCPTSALAMLSIQDITEHHIVAAIKGEATDLTSISWKTLSQETTQDPMLSQLIYAIHSNFECDTSGIAPFLRYRDSLYVEDGVVMYQDRVVVPKSLRQSVLDSLQCCASRSSSYATTSAVDSLLARHVH